MVNIQRRELLASLAIGITCGLLVFIFAKGPNTSTAITFSDSNLSQVDLVTPVIAPSDMTPASVVQDSATRQTSQPTPPSPAGIPTAQTVRIAGEKGEDLNDVLLLYDSAHEQDFDINFCQLASYHGVGCKRLDLRKTPLTDDLLKDTRGHYFRLIGISAQTLEAPPLVLPDELDLIKQSVKVGGANLLVAELVGEEGYEGYPNLKSLTDNVVLGADAPEDSRADWFISNQMPDLTREFTGQVISCTQISQPDSAIILGKPLSALGMPIVALGPTSTPVLTPVATPTGTPVPTPVATPTGTLMPTLTVEEQLARKLHEPWAAKDWDEVIRLIEQILAINPDYDDMTEKLYASHVNYGRKLAAEGRLEEAKEEFTRALAIKPDGGEAIAGLQALAGQTPVPLPTPTQPQSTIHVVQPRENLSGIAKQYGITAETLQEASAILDRRRLQIGQELVIPREKEALTAVITSVDDSGTIYPIFMHYKAGAGSILVSAGDSHRNLADTPMRDLYEPCTFSELIPLMFAFRFALGDEVWHSNYAYANLFIDDPPLQDHYLGLRYAELLAQMKKHNFHTTIALIPIYYDRSDPLVSHLFLENPDYFSIVQHGNNHDGYEFYKYEVSQTDPHPARALTEQKADIIEGLARMDEHKKLTGVPYGKIMIFPWNMSPAPTLIWLKVNNFNATINADNIPLDSKPGDNFDFNMYQAVMNYGNFPSIGRRPVPPGGLSGLGFQRLLFDLFIGKPLLLFSHVDEVFRHGIDGFNQTADAINQLPTAVEWRSLDYIVKHLYLEKRNDDGSIDVKWYGNHLIITNTSNQGRIYHLQKEETLNVPIASLTVNDTEFPFRVQNNTLLLALYVPARTSAEVVITYGP